MYKGTFDTDDILTKIGKYLNGLDNIVSNANVNANDTMPMQEEEEEVLHCREPMYGHFVLVINRMLGDSSNDDMLMSLIAPDSNTN